jgi:C4-dicarboxylate transporter DctM subunit
VLILLLLNVALLALGAVVDIIAILLIIVPVIVPIAVQLGMDPVHFGVMVIFNLAIGLLTPPIGYCLFVAGSIANVPITTISLRIIPFLLIATGVLLLVTYFEPLTLWLPQFASSH